MTGYISLLKIDMLKKMLVTLVFCMLSLWSNGQEIQLADSLVLKTLDGKRLNKQQSEYDSQSNEVLRLYSVWSQPSHAWRPSVEYTYKYDDNGNILQEEAFTMDSISNEWDGIFKHVSEFDDQGREMKKTYYSWNQTEGDWTTNDKCEIERDEDGNKIEDMSYFGDQNEWVQYEYKTYEYKYDNTGNCATMHVFELDAKDIKSYGKPKYEYTYEYDDRGNLLSSSLYQRLDEYQWIPKNRFEYEYDSDGNRILETFYTGDEDYGNWDEYYKYGHEYDNGRLTSMFFYYWNKEASEWAGKYNYLYEYNEAKNPILVKLHIWDNGTWILNEIGTYYYPETQTAALSHSASREGKITVFPNSMAGSITISGAEKASLAIADMQGRIVYTKKNIKEQETIQTASWIPGAYVVSLLLNGQRISRKVLVGSY